MVDVVVDVEDGSVGDVVAAVGSSSDDAECVGADMSVCRQNIFFEDIQRLKILMSNHYVPMVSSSKSENGSADALAECIWPNDGFSNFLIGAPNVGYGGAIPPYGCDIRALPSFCHGIN